MDQGKTLLNIYQLWQERKFTLIGPESSLKTINGLSFFHGPWIYYFLLPLLLLLDWNPLAGSYFFIFINLLALIILFFTIKKQFGQLSALLSSLLFTISPPIIYYSQFLWNPNFLPLVSSLIIFISVKILGQPTKSTLFFFLGFILGFGLSNHYQTFILVVIIFLWMVFNNQKFVNFLFTISGIIIGTLPLVIFEFKHNFYNFRIIFFIIKQGLINSNPIIPHFYYFLFLTPFLCLFFGIFLAKIFNYNLFLGIIIVILISIYSFNHIFKKPASGFTMPQGWNYLGQKKITEIILKENKSNYNIANLLWGDTRDYPLRYLLTIAKNPPLNIDQYPQSKYLFVTAREQQKVVNNPVWEINSFCPCKISKSWPIQNNINLYLLEKSSL